MTPLVVNYPNRSKNPQALEKEQELVAPHEGYDEESMSRPKIPSSLTHFAF